MYIEMFVFFVLILNIIVSIYIYKRDDLNSFQKKAQVILTWLFPIIASIGIYFFHRNTDKSEKTGENSSNNNVTEYYDSSSSSSD